MSAQLRIGVVGVYHETNTFAPGVTQWEDFLDGFTVGKEAFLEAFRHTRTTMGGVIEAADQRSVLLEPGIYASATPSGIVSAEAAQRLMEQIAASVKTGLDGLVVILHGAMVSEQHSDMEVALLETIRSVVGKEMPIAVTVDLHANLGEQMPELCNLLVGYDTYPHIDAYERGLEAVDLLIRHIRGEIHPTIAIARPNMLVVPQTMITTEGVMKRIMETAFEIENDPEVLNVTVCGGFPYSDVPCAGMAFVVTTNRNEQLALSYADSLAQLAWSLRDEFVTKQLSLEQAMKEALDAKEGPVILVEGSDNVGGGAPADGTHILPALLKFPKPSLIMLRDPEAVAAAVRVGVGARMKCKVGGKSDRLHGEPVPVEGRVRLLSDGRYTHRGPYMKGQAANMGTTAVIEAGEVTIILTEQRVPPWDIGHAASLGLDPASFHIIVVKSAIAWISAYGPVAKQVIPVDTPGCCTVSLDHLVYRNLHLPIHPFMSLEKEHAQ
ncbi:hypothetical protein DVH26_16665 [Paenibacillus sp. H1-7]|uniref:M81 family metallopeptidase n=1 Tax=Paenibacillus sp. H1-7 TaxID=2282849 RepID=UPI001EF9916D|nr:M81 family metallopeptidase [Paenibacillus sp. H1-7]ULL15931.1 hypothetical protein DVH26_16665 [Paenibacillus sp. H1-7]